jgi:hypothetical protein
MERTVTTIQRKGRAKTPKGKVEGGGKDKEQKVGSNGEGLQERSKRRLYPFDFDGCYSVVLS